MGPELRKFGHRSSRNPEWGLSYGTFVTGRCELLCGAGFAEHLYVHYVKCVDRAGAACSGRVLRVVHRCVRGTRTLSGLIFLGEEAAGGHLMAYVFAEVNFAAPQDPSGTVIGLDGICAGLVAFLEAASDAFSCARRGSVGLLGVGFLLLLGGVVFLLAAGTLRERGKTYEGGKCEQSKN